ncbi:centromere/kinetochore protein zw10 [Dorcoceras hygrometricum]|uniref:Centromere/kinetochore protein zw10 n=1 Tax=Dorcoceras hygrometricum TaxID=472368 RepID=A0A2Z7BHN4_9LAMI|nr:centromere/kinetochore protein zw10 [Dorcoceras hygrometricum]
MLYANWETLSTSWAPPAGSKPRPAEKPGKPENNTQATTPAQRDLGAIDGANRFHNTHQIKQLEFAKFCIDQVSRLVYGGRAKVWMDLL